MERLFLAESVTHGPPSGFNVASCETNLAHEQLTEQGRQLSHYSMDEYFYPKIVLTFVPSKPEIALVQHRQSWSWTQLLTVLLAIITVFLAISLRQTQVQLSDALQSGHVLDQDPAAGIRETPYTPEVIETITITATTTVIASPPKDSPARWYYPNPGSPQAMEGDSQARPAEAASPPPMPPPDAPTPATPQMPTLTPTPVHSPVDEHALAPFHYFFDPLSIRLELPKIDFSQFHLPESANATLQQVLQSLDTVYQLFRKVLHYPLDPP